MQRSPGFGEYSSENDDTASSWKPGGPPAAAKAGNGVGCDNAQLCLSNPQLRKQVSSPAMVMFQISLF